MSALVQLAISLGGAGLVVQILLLRQNRRKIAGEASASEANAASTLSGAALTMVENAQQDAREARHDAKAARVEADQARDETEKLWEQYNRARWMIHHLQMRGAALENALRQAGIEVPPSPEYDEQPPKAAPPAIADGPSPAGPPV